MTTLTDPRAFLRSLYDTAVQRALPAHNTAAHLPRPPDTSGPRRGRTLVLGAGKAGGAMAAAVDALWPADAPLSGLVVTRYEHVPPAYRRCARKTRGASKWWRHATRCPTKPAGTPRSASPN